ncbi:DUF4232 domain-containing protein [Streptomyces rhizosphaerihabitans]|uniref:DUF4232 domain-containing protein n=1 Tax=Streptomyces rhizosphaerihabitans TaxID=1266770 RepID=UPI0021C05E64|nr:DUF4232 domain-containing protein [Streptomyces rhizosphaerihabitans]MCT9011697.1 DUF4232 domain-containing protein [Streptomyces rhizosphaerihabitans]
MNTPARRNHKSPRGWKSYALGAAAAAALLATTACDPGAAEGSDSSKSSAQPSATASAKPGGASGNTGGGDGAGSGASSAGSSGSSAGSGGSTSSGGRTSSAGSTGGTSGTSSSGTGGSGGTAGSGGSTGGGGKETIAACSQTELGVSAVKERDARHLVLTVQNAGTKKCNLYRYPLVRLGDGTRNTPVIKDSDPTPGVPVTLAPGQEAYAALLVAGGARDEYEAKSITLTLQGSTPGSIAGKAIDVPMPVSTLYADDGQLVTYWTTASGVALDFIMSN